MRIEYLPVRPGVPESYSEPGDHSPAEILEGANGSIGQLNSYFFRDEELPETLVEANAFLTASWSIRQSTTWGGNFYRPHYVRLFRKYCERNGLDEFAAIVTQTEAAIATVDPSHVAAFFNYGPDIPKEVAKFLQAELFGRYEPLPPHFDDDFWDDAYRRGVRAIAEAGPFEVFPSAEAAKAATLKLIDALPDYAGRAAQFPIDPITRLLFDLCVQANERFYRNDWIKVLRKDGTTNIVDWGREWWEHPKFDRVENVWIVETTSGVRLVFGEENTFVMEDPISGKDLALIEREI